MWLKEIEILGVGGIEELKLTFDPRMNIICGPNGIGKTTVLESVAHTFSSGRTNVLKRSAKSQSSFIKSKVDVDNLERISNIEFDVFIPSQQALINGINDLSDNLLSLKINRTFEYKALASVDRDPEKQKFTTWGEAQTGINLNNVKSWFVNRYMYTPHGTLTQTQVSNYELARSSFSALNKSFSFSRVDASTNEILVNTPSGEIYYEYLSSGFKSCLSIIFGIIKEIEFRFIEPKIKAIDFDGIILIDEVELHLHPEWQTVIISVLIKTFPKAQFICTTHSPHVIQSAQPNQIIAIENREGKTTQRILPSTEHGFKGWTIEEVLMDVMGMNDLRTSVFTETIEKFEIDIKEESYDSALESYNKLEAMLHPNNHMKKMLRFQLASIKGARID